MYNILHVEQSDFFCKMVKKIISDKGYAYIQTDSFNDALHILETEDINLIITSLYAKGGNVEDFIKCVNYGDKKETPIFVVTSNTMDETKMNLIDLGISEYILKDEFEKEIESHMDAVFVENEYMENLKEANIAVVEDSTFETLIEKDIFRKYEIKNVDYYKSGKKLLEGEKKYDIYLIDIILKNEFGKDLIRTIRRNNINASIIAVTSLNNTKTVSSILNSGADDVIHKPIDENIFIAKLKSNIRVYTLNKRISKMIKELKK
ncbi:Response regulator receiver domain-containing protein [Clostridium cavendishii DSM 21758]|uniref:Stage 0 sporulation protein A homolog n=1 Tax=Clostridium cavendishii DSM 21758 TaxID=1121302 RepID=A0A1M6EUU8_9CLOT|nr:response regulator [Clostridium cavendishii]SHI89244.1 Response regulator receiver domain-containing protein [Clostridium cavendishii DSM 21758]